MATDGTPGIAPAYDRIAQLLGAVLRRQRGERVRAGLGAGLLVDGVWALGAALAGPRLVPPWGLWPLALLPLVLSAVAAAWPLPREAAAAASLRLSDLGLRSALRSAVELRQLAAARGAGASRDLIEAHAIATAERVGEVNVARARPAGVSSWLLAAGLLFVALDLLLGTAGPPGLVAGFAALLSPRPAAGARSSAARDPITSDVTLTYLYPAHTHLAPRTVTGTDGTITAPAGTQVRLQTRADRAVAAAAAVVDGASVPLDVAGGRDLSGTLVVRRAGSYRFRFLGAGGRTLAEGPPIPIALQADAPPEVAIDAPTDGFEVQPHDLVGIRWRASDDYGLSQVALVYRAPGRPGETRVILRKTPEAPRHLRGEDHLDLAPLSLSPGDTLSYTVEALDNDAVEGPKSGRAPARTLKVFSAAEHHREALEAARALWEKLVLVLADRVDEKVDRPRMAESAAEAADGRALALCDRMEVASRKLHADAAAPAGLTAALATVAREERSRASATVDARDWAHVRSFSGGGGRAAPLAAALEEEIAGLERDVPYLEKLLDAQTVEDLVALEKELAARRRELAALFEKYRRSPTPELRAALMAQLARLKERFAELLDREAKLAKGLSDEHLNHRALEDLNQGHDIGANLDAVEKKLATGDVDGAMKELDEMGNLLDEMQGRLQRLAGEAGNQYPGLARKLSDFQRDLGALADGQRQLARDTEAVRDRARKLLERQAPALRELAHKLAREAAQAEGELGRVPPETLPPGLYGEDIRAAATGAVGRLRQALEAGDVDEAGHEVEKAVPKVEEIESGLDREARIARSYGGLGGALPGADRLAEAHGHAQGALRPLHDIAAALQKLRPDESAALDPADRRRLGQMARRQAQLERQLGQVRQDMQAVQQSAPLFDPSAQRQLDGAGDGMEAARGSLEGSQPGPAAEHAQDALQRLEAVRDAMRRGGRGGSGSGMPLPFLAGGDEGSTGAPSADEKVVIPGADQYQVPPEFRRDILDAMRQKPPPQYEEQVKKYYQEIVR